MEACNTLCSVGVNSADDNAELGYVVRCACARDDIVIKINYYYLFIVLVSQNQRSKIHPHKMTSIHHRIATKLNRLLLYYGQQEKRKIAWVILRPAGAVSEVILSFDIDFNALAT
jgi:hypothetical protein